MSATVGWNRFGWSSGAWSTSPDALATVTGVSTSTSLGNVIANAPSAIIISGEVLNCDVSDDINVGIAVTDLVLTGQEITSSINSVSTGEGREVTITALQQIELELNFGNGWNREEYSSGAWSTPLGEVVTGNGNVFIEDGQSVTASVANVSMLGDTRVVVTGESAVVSQGDFIVSSNNFLSTTGQQINTTIGTYTIAAGGAITVVVPEFTINANVSTINVGTAMNAAIVGQVLNTSSGSFIISADQILPITGNSANANVSSITIKAEHFQLMTGQEMTTSLANFILSTNNFVLQTGQEITVTPVNLRFWDPIVDDNTETWTNI